MSWGLVFSLKSMTDSNGLIHSVPVFGHETKQHDLQQITVHMETSWNIQRGNTQRMNLCHYVLVVLGPNALY